MSLEKLHQVKRTDTSARLVQTFFTPEEKEELKNISKATGTPMSHLIRALTLEWLVSQKK